MDRQPAHPVMPVPQPAAGTQLFYLDDAGVLFSEPRQELLLLNRTGAVIWTLMEEGAGAGAIADTLVTEYGVARGDADAFVVTALADWAGRGLLAGSASAAPADRPTAPARTGPPFPGLASGPVAHYRLLETEFTIRYAGITEAAVVEPVLSHLRCDGVHSSAIEIDVVTGARGIDVYWKQKWYAACDGADALAPVVKGLIWMTVLREQRYFLDIHAGVVGDGEGCLLMPAAPGSGKSTLTAALAHAGYRFFSDEVALLASDTLHVYPVPLAICVKDHGIEALAGHFPVLNDLAVHRRGDGKRVVYMPPPAAALTDGMPRPARAIVFPRYVPGASTVLESLSRGEALQRLLVECLAVAERLDAARVGALVRWIGEVSCHALTFGALDDAVEAIGRVFPLRRSAQGTP